MRSSALPVSATCSTPRPTCAVEARISALMSLAASAERCARPRTSEATTAKPRPASPARAASTPALSASRLVWKAISSITPMIWLICCAERWISPIAATASRTTAPPCSASLMAVATMARVALAPCAVSRHGGRHLGQRRRGLGERRRLPLRALRQVVGGGGDLHRAGADARWCWRRSRPWCRAAGPRRR